MCDWCEDRGTEDRTFAAYEQNILALMRHLRDEAQGPVFVNYVATVNVSVLRDATSGSLVQGLTCQCGIGDDDDDEFVARTIALRDRIIDFQKRLAADEYDDVQTKDFAITYMGAFESGQPLADTLAPDKFHLNEMGHRIAAQVMVKQ